MERNQRIEEELFPFYALDALTEEERAEVDGYVAGNPAAAARLAVLMRDAADLTMATTPPITPAPAVKAGLMARVAADARPATPQVAAAAPPPRPAAEPRSAAARRSWRDWFTSGRPAMALTAFALVAFIVSAAAVARLSRQNAAQQEQIAALQADDAVLRAQLDALTNENEVLRRGLAEREDLLAQFRHPGMRTVAIGDATGDHPAAVGTLTTDMATGETTLRVSNLPLPSSGDTYQAWVIVGETPVSAGTFVVDANGNGTHILSGELPPEFDAIGVSMEPEGGSATPTQGKIILLGRML